MIDAQSSLSIARPPEAVFSVIEDFGRAPEWLEACAELKQVSPGARAAGASLHYTYDQGGRKRSMDGVLRGYEKDRWIEMKFGDARFEVVVAFQLSPANGGTLVTHTIGIGSKSFFFRLFSPLVRAGNRMQVANNLQRLKSLLEKAT